MTDLKIKEWWFKKERLLKDTSLQKQVENTWPEKKKTLLLEVVWYETFNDETKGIPTAVEGQVLQDFLIKTVDYQDGM
jgi:hypothetical protein